MPQEHIIPQRMNAPHIKMQTGSVDLENRVIEGVIIMEPGEAKGHGFHVEEEFLDDFIAFVNDEKDGKLRSNFGHNWDNMGLQLGRYEKFRRDGDKVRADLTVLKASDNSPVLPGIGSYILEMAQEAPDQIMNSIVFVPEYFYQYDEDGNQVILENYDWWTGRFANENPKEIKYAKFGEAFSSDMVDDGAITSTLMSANKKKIKKNMSTPKSNSEKTLFEKLTEKFNALTAKIEALSSGNAAEEEVEETAPPADEGAPEVTEDQLSAMMDQITALEKKIKEMGENTPAAQHASGRSNGDDITADDELPSWMSNPVNQRAARFSKKSKNDKK